MRKLNWHARANRAGWNRESDRNQAKHDDFLRRGSGLRWGIWQVPDSEVGAFGDVSGLRVLDLGCGGGQLLVKLAQSGAEVTGLDVSERQLDHARRGLASAGIDADLIWASADDIPCCGDAFDLVCSDHGGLTYADPRTAIPEAARVLRPGGRLVFNTSTPWAVVCWDPTDSGVTPELRNPYFGMIGYVVNDRLRSFERDDILEFQLTYGDWIRTLTRANLAIDDLVELRPPAGLVSAYSSYVSAAWATRWPAEHVWIAHKAT
jgi:SAM-dependent methyltransferase